MGCRKYKIQDYFTLQNSQNEADTYAYDADAEERNLTKTQSQLLLCIQNILKILFQICDLRTKPLLCNIINYTYDDNSGNKTNKKSYYAIIYPSTDTYNNTEKIPFTTTILPVFSKRTNNISTYKYAGTNPFKFRSEYYDTETGLVYYNYRYYSPELGRWLSRDPIAIVGSTAWWADNPERIKLHNTLKKTESMIDVLYSLISHDFISLHGIHEAVQLLRERILFLQYEIQMDLLGKRNNANNDNPYSHTVNNPINRTEYLGLGDFFNDIVLGNAFYEAGLAISSNNNMQNSPIPISTIGVAAGALIIMGGSEVFAIGGAIVIGTGGWGALGGVPFMIVGGEMIIWGVQLIRGCATKCKGKGK